MSEIQKIKYRAIFYGRVSTVHDEQAESIDNQMLQAQNMLSRRKDIELIAPLETYCEKVSGKTDERPKFQEVVECLESGAANLLIIKDLKRLSRSVMVTYDFFDKMETYGFEIFILSTNKILDAKEFEETENQILYGVEALMAENMVRTQSKYGKVYQSIRCENKILSYKDAQLFGYYWDYETGGPAIDKEKAAIVVEIFDRYVFKRESIKEIRKYLLSIGLKYSAPTIIKWLQEGKYVGDWTINRKGSRLQIGTGKKTIRYDLDKSEWVHIERPDLVIIDKSVFDLAQRIRANNTRPTLQGEAGHARFQGTHLFASKIYCGECGSPYRFDYADRDKTIAIYRDSFGVKSMDKAVKCTNQAYRRVYEADMIKITVEVYNLISQRGNIDIDLLIKAIEKALKTGETGNEKKIKAKNKEIASLETKILKISESFLKASDEIRECLNKQSAELGVRVKALKAELDALENADDSVRNISDQLLEIKSVISSWSFITEEDVDRELIQAFVKVIRVYKDGKLDFVLSSEDVIKFQLSPDPKGGPKKDFPILLPNYNYEQEVKELISKWRECNKVVPIMGYETAEITNRLNEDKQRRFKVKVEVVIPE